MEDTEKGLLTKVEKEIEKLKYYLEESDEIIKEGDFIEIEVTITERQQYTTGYVIASPKCKNSRSSEALKLQELFVSGKRIRKKDSLRGYYRWERSKTPSVRDERKSKTKSTGRKPTKRWREIYAVKKSCVTKSGKCGKKSLKPS